MTEKDWDQVRKKNTKKKLLIKVNIIISNLCFSQVCFSDESTFQILTDKTVFVRRRVGEMYHPDCLVQTIKHPTSIMVWSVINSRGSGRLYIVEGTCGRTSIRKYCGPS